MHERYIFFIQLFLAVTIYVYKLPRRKYFILRLIASIGLILAIQALYDLFDLLYDTVPTALYISKFVLMLFLFVLAVWFCFDNPLKKTVLYATGGYAVQNCAYHTRLIIYFSFDIRLRGWQNELVTACIFFAVYSLMFFLIHKAKKADLEADIDYKSTVIISIVTIFVAIVMTVNIPFSERNPLYNMYGVIISFILIIVQLGIFRISIHKKEIQTFEQLLQMERKQHEISKETIEMINYKCHNIKHEIAAILGGNNPESQENLKEIQERISIYSSIARTGNDTLDIILTEKSLRCENYEITFSYMIDGQSLAFMSTVDICSLFGNALDNAIESVMNVEPEKRFISLSVSCAKNFLSIHTENFCDKKLKFEDDLPVTQKDDKNFHGYGVKTIRLIVQKYKGHMAMYTENNLFHMDVMIPLEKIS